MVDLKKKIKQRIKEIEQAFDKKKETENTQELEHILFITDFGQEFDDAYQGLTNFVSLATLVQPLIQKSSKDEIILPNPEKILEFWKKYLEKNKKITLKNRERGKELIEQMEKQWGLMKNTFNSNISELEKISPQLQKENNEKGKEKTDVKKIPSSKQVWEELKIKERVFSYFVLTLYAHIEFYTLALIQFVTYSIETDQTYYFLKDFRFYDYNTTITHILDFLKTENKQKLSSIINNLTKQSQWEQDKQALSSLAKIRHIIAHRKPIQEIETIMNQFPNQKKKALKNAKKLDKEWKELKTELGIFYELLSMFLDVLKYFMFVIELGTSCYRYLCLVDNVLALYFDYEEPIMLNLDLLLNLKTHMKNKEDAKFVENAINHWIEQHSINVKEKEENRD